jgi:hypothetical protein
MAEGLEFDIFTGKLRVRRDSHNQEISVFVKMDCCGFGAHFVTPHEKNKLEIYPTSYYEEKVLVKTIHISYQSDT